MKFNRHLLYNGAEEALIYTNQTRFHEEGDSLPHLVRTAGEELAREVMAIEKLMQRLVRTNRQLFKWPIKMPVKPHPSRGLGRLAEDFLRNLRPSLWSIRQSFPRHHLHPLVELFERHMEKHGFVTGFRPGSEANVASLNACIGGMRDEARSEAFHSRLDAHYKAVRNNTKSLLQLIEALFAVHSQLLVVRIDLCYRRHPLKPWLGLPITEEEARDHRGQMIKYLQRKCRFKPVGYAWKMEYAEHTAWHTHLLLFFDANHHQQDITIADHIGKHWNQVVTGDKGRYYISNAEPHVQPGVGKIRYDDTKKLWALRAIVAPYLTKADYYIRLVTPPKMRSFGRSGPPDIPTKKLGRPRISISARVSAFPRLFKRAGHQARNVETTRKRRSGKYNRVIGGQAGGYERVNPAQTALERSSLYQSDVTESKISPTMKRWVL